MNTLKGENVYGYGLYIKSTYDGPQPELRRPACENCTTEDWPYIGFHDDARIYTQAQKTLIEAPVVEFFGNTELDAYTMQSSKTQFTVKADSLVFHDSAIFAGKLLDLLPLTVDPAIRNGDDAMRYGIVNDLDGKYYMPYGPAILMDDRLTPVLELGYQRCYEPPYAPTLFPNKYSKGGGEPTPRVGGDIIVAFKHEFTLPIFNTVVANHARISFLTQENGSEYVNAAIRTDLLRIRNKVGFYTDPLNPTKRVGVFEMTSQEQMPTQHAAGIYPHHLHLEPGSELSLTGEDPLVVIATTTVGGYGEIHQDVQVKANGIIAPGYASLMEWDCTSGKYQGSLTVHNLFMEKDAVMRVSIGKHNDCFDPETGSTYTCTQTDTLIVHDSIFFVDKVPLYILPDELDVIEPGCYLFMIYDDLGNSVEYVKNLILMNTQYGGYYFGLDKSEPGRVYLCVTELPIPIIQRYINIHSIEGVKTDPVSNLYHYVKGHEDFTFTATYTDKENPFEVYAIGYYSRKDVTLTPKYLFSGTYEYKIRQVVEPWDVYFSVEPRNGDTGNTGIFDQRVWSYRNTLFVNVDVADVVSIYNVTGVLYQKHEIPAGLKKLTLDQGIYIVTLKDGSVYKIIIN